MLQIGIAGNTLVVMVVLMRKHMKTTTNVYIINLAVADILMCLGRWQEGNGSYFWSARQYLWAINCMQCSTNFSKTWNFPASYPLNVLFCSVVSVPITPLSTFMDSWIFGEVLCKVAGASQVRGVCGLH